MVIASMDKLAKCIVAYNILSTICSHWPLLCMETKEHHDAHIDFAVKYTLRGSIQTKRSRKMRWNFLIIILTSPITFRIMN